MTPNANSSKVLVFVTLAYDPVIGGAERQAQMLLEHWADRGKDVWVLTRRVPGSPAHEIIHGVQVYRLWSLWLPFFSWFTFSASVLVFLFPKRRDIASLWSFMLNAAAFAAVLAGRYFKRPVVIRISASGAGGNLHVMQSSLGGSSLARFMLNGCRCVITLNDETEKELQEYRLPLEKIKRIRNGVNGSYFQPASESQRQALRQQVGLTDQQIATLFVGRLDEQKNVKNILSVWPKVLEKYPYARLLLVGEGPQGGLLKQWTRSLGLGESVKFLGWRKDILSLYQACDLFILPSYFEGLPNALLEAMACELAVMVSRIPGNVEVVGDGRTGIWLDPNQPLEWVQPWHELIRDAGLRKKLGKEARRSVLTKYSIESAFNSYDLLNTTVSNR